MGKSAGEQIKEKNTLAVLNAIMEKQPISRVDLVKNTKLAFPTIMRIIDVFIGMNLVVEIGKGDTGAGRKPTLLNINRDAFYVIGVVIHTSIDVTIVDALSNVIVKWSEPLNKSFDSDKQIEKIIQSIEMILKNSDISIDKIKGMGVGMPGVDFKSNNLINDSQFSGWQNNIDVKKILEDKFGIDVYVENMSRTLTNSEIYFGSGKVLKDFVYVMLDFGVSGSVVKKSKIFLGKDNVAGEYGHMSIDPINGRTCYCGNKGCIESYVSKQGIVKTVVERIDSTSLIYEMVRGNIENIDFDIVVSAYEQGDFFAIEIFKEVGKLLGYFLTDIVNFINPTAIVLGGSVINSSDIIKEEAERVVNANVFSNKARNVKVLKSTLSVEKQLLGTTYKVINNILKEYAIGKK